MTFPTIREVTQALRDVHESLQGYAEGELDDGEGNEGTDVRLQVWPDGSWNVHSGDASYDQDHRGFWGASFLHQTSTVKALRELAKELLSQARDQHAEEAS